MAKLYLCYHCTNDKGVPGKPFAAEGPRCPACGIDQADKRVAHLIVPRKLVHFEPPHPVVAAVGSGELACGAKAGPGVRVTKEIVAANCPNCLASDAGKAAHHAQAMTGDEFDLVGTLDLKEQTIKAEG